MNSTYAIKKAAANPVTSKSATRWINTSQLFDTGPLDKSSVGTRQSDSPTQNNEVGVPREQQAAMARKQIRSRLRSQPGCNGDVLNLRRSRQNIVQQKDDSTCD